MVAYNRPPGRAGGLPIGDTGLRQGWTAEAGAKQKPRRKLVIASTVNPAARAARKAEKAGKLRLRLD